MAAFWMSSCGFAVRYEVNVPPGLGDPAGACAPLLALGDALCPPREQATRPAARPAAPAERRKARRLSARAARFDRKVPPCMAPSYALRRGACFNAGPLEFCCPPLLRL